MRHAGGTVRLAHARRAPFFDDPRRACADVDPELFFPDKGNKWQAAAAKQVCAHCPVLEDCRRWALGVCPLHGIWGGMSQGDRERWRARHGGGSR